MTDLVATSISREAAVARLAARFAPWPRAGLRWSTKPGYGLELGEDGFAVRALPRITGSPLYEAIGRWRAEGGVAVEIAPMALAYMPLVLTNAVLLTVLLMAILFFGARGNLEQTIEGTGFLGLALFAIVLLAQLMLIALIERARGQTERGALLAAIRDTLGD